MNNLTTQLLPQVIKVINEYGVLVNVYRDIYENDEVGIKQLKEKKTIVAAIRVVIDNSSKTSDNINRFKTEGIIRPQSSAVLYYAYDSNLNLQREDYILIDGIKYIFNTPQNILHYNILYQVSAEATIDDAL